MAGNSGRKKGLAVALATVLAAVALTTLSAGPADAASDNWLTKLLASLQPKQTTTTTTPTTAKPPTQPPAPGAPTCGGVTIKKANGQPWVCTFADEFDGSALDRTKWVPQTTAASNFGSGDDCFVDDPDNVRVANGKLELSVVKEAQPVTCSSSKRAITSNYTSGSVSTFQRWSQAFGRFEFRAKFPTVPRAGAYYTKGLHGALWLWPDNQFKYGPWPLSGEIDVAEVFSLYNDRAIPYLHYGTTSKTVTNNFCLLTVDQWHTYAVEWTTTNITILYDGKVCLDHRIAPTIGAAPMPFDHPFMVALTQGLGYTGNEFDPASGIQFPATLQVDWVRVWT